MTQRLLSRQFGVGHEVLVGHRAHQQVADETQHQQAGEDIQGDVVSGCAFNADAQLIFTQVVHQYRAQYTRSRPSGEQATVDRAHHLRAEQVGQVRWHGRKTSAVHRQDDAERRHEQRNVAQVAEIRDQRVQGKTQGEEHKVSVFTAQVVGERRPEEPATDVEQAQQPSEARSDGRDGGQLAGIQLAKRHIHTQQLAAEHFLQQRRSHAEDADTGRYVQAQHQPDQAELWGFPRHIHVDVTVGNHRVAGFFRRRGPALRLPAGWRNTIGQCTANHEHEVDRGHHQEALPHAYAGWRSEVAH